MWPLIAGAAVPLIAAGGFVAFLVFGHDADSATAFAKADPNGYQAYRSLVAAHQEAQGTELFEDQMEARRYAVAANSQDVVRTSVEAVAGSHVYVVDDAKLTRACQAHGVRIATSVPKLND